MADTNIATALLAALNKREELANAAKVHWDRFRIEASRNMWPSEAQHAQAWNPHAVLRNITSTRQIVARHAPCEHADSEPIACEWCGNDTWPCHDLLDIADAWGVNP